MSTSAEVVGLGGPLVGINEVVYRARDDLNHIECNHIESIRGCFFSGERRYHTTGARAWAKEYPKKMSKCQTYVLELPEFFTKFCPG